MMNTNHKAIRVMKQAAAPPDRLICLSKEGGDGGPQVTRGPVLGVVWASAPQSPRERKRTLGQLLVWGYFLGLHPTDHDPIEGPC